MCKWRELKKRALAQTPPELLSDVIEKGAFIAGGGALVRGIASRLSMELGIPAQVAHDPLVAIARGGYASLQDQDLLARIVLSGSSYQTSNRFSPAWASLC
ncbi:MAG: hypothetical protein EOP06_06245 [Proteobacteria bacterium]|nr:MAG: hypothetical protein EOP06_06245 [Pseudomonadota bacterium]